MRFKAMLLILAALALAATPVLAKTPPKSLDYRTETQTVVARAYMEGFEGAFPPAGWTQTITNPTYTWVQDTSAYEGFYGARVPWQAATGNQNERLGFNYFIDSGIDEDHLIFATMGSPYWAVNANFRVEVNGTVVWDFLLDGAGGTFEWEVADVDLSGYDGQNVYIEFIYGDPGDDGADHHLDAVMIDEGAPPPPPPPENDDCTGVIDLQAQGETMFAVDLCLATDVFSPGEYPTSCTGYGATGADVVYSIYLTAGETFTASQQGSHDSAIYVVTDCYDPVNTCVAGADATLSGDVETVTFVAPSDGVYYLIIDGYSGCSLTTVWVDAPVATDDVTFGAVKNLYR